MGHITRLSTLEASSWATCFSDNVGSIYICGNAVLVYKTTDNGASFTSTNTHPYSIITATCSNSGIIYAVAGSYVTYGLCIIKSEDYGATWSLVYDCAGYLSPKADPVISSNGYVYFIIDNRVMVYKESDESTTVLPVVETAGDLCNICIDIYNNVYIAHTYGHIYKSSDNGLSWSQLGNVGLWVMVICDNTGNVYAGAAYGYIYKSIDGGETWTQSSSITSSGWRKGIVKSDGSLLVLSTGDNMIESIDGNTWSVVTDTTPRSWKDVASNSSGFTLAITSEYSDYIYKVNPPLVDTPTSNIGSGMYQGSVQVSLSCSTNSSTIYYTIDGSDPSESSAEYISPITINSTTTLKAIGYKSGYGNSNILKLLYKMISNSICENPIIYPSMVVNGNIDIEIRSITPSSTIYYTIDGPTPTELSNVYSGIFSIPYSATVRAVAKKASYQDSNISSMTYSLGSQPRKNYEFFNYELGYGIEGIPSYINGGGAVAAINNRVAMSYGGRIRKYSPSQDSEYNSNYVLKFLLDTRYASSEMFSVLCYGNTSNYVPVIRKTTGGVELGWVIDTSWAAEMSTSAYDEAVRGDFNGTKIYEDGEYTIIYIKKTGEPNSDVMMRVISPSGASYSTGWLTIATPHKEAEIGTIYNGSSGIYYIGPITSYDCVNEQFIEEMRLLPVCNPPVIIPESGMQVAAAHMTMSTPIQNSKIYYSFSGIPSQYNSMYQEEVIITSDSNINAISVNDSYEDSPINALGYVVVPGGAIEIIEPWNDNGSWQFSNEVVMSGGNLIIDTSVAGSVAANMYSVSEFSNIYSGYKGFPCQCIEIDIDSSGSFRFGAHQAIPEFTSNMRAIEFNYDGSRTSFFIRGVPLDGFDGNSYISSSKLKVRAALGNGFRLSVCRQNGELVSDTGWLGRSDFPSRIGNITRNNIANNDSNVVGCLGMYWQNGSRSSDNTTMAMSILSGVFSASPYRTISNCTVGGAERFILTGNVDSYSMPDSPIVNTTEHSSGMYNVTITPDNASKVLVTINEGPYVSNIYELLTNHRLMISEVGSPLTINIADPCVLRIAAYNGIASSLSSTYVGKTTDVPIPEIAPRFGSIPAGTSLPVRISCANSGADIRYTLDGSDPTELSQLYTGTIFLRDTTTIKAKTFIGGSSSILKYGFFWDEYPLYAGLIVCNDIPNISNSDFWNYDDNATFSGGNIEITGESSVGVSLRSDILPIHDKHVTNIGFHVNGNFRLKFPGYDNHFAWVGNNIGKIEGTSSIPDTDISGASSISVVLYIVDGIVKVIKAIPIDGNDEEMTTLIFTYEEPTGLSFTSEGIGSYIISNLQVMVVDCWYNSYAGIDTNVIPNRPWNIPGKPTLVSPSGNNIAGTRIAIQPGYSSDNIYSVVAVSEGTSTSVSTTSYQYDIELGALSAGEVSRAQVVAFEYTTASLAKASTLVGHGDKIISSLGFWDVERSGSISDIYACGENGYKPGLLSTCVLMDGQTDVKVEITPSGSNASMVSVLPLDFIHQYKSYTFMYPYSNMDEGNAFFRFDTPNLYEIDGWPDLIISCGWGIQGIPEVVKVVDTTNNSQSARLESLVSHSVTPSSYISLYDTNTWTATTYHNRYITANDDITWHCGRKIDNGKIYVRTIVKDKIILSKVLFDTGWIDAGTIPSEMPRPRIIVRLRRVQRCLNTIGSTKGYFIRGMSNITTEQLDRYMLNGTIKGIMIPHITDSNDVDITSYSASSHPEANDYVTIKWPILDVNNQGADALYIRAGSHDINIRDTSFSNGSDSHDEGLLLRESYYSGYSVSMPSISNIVAYNLYDKIRDGDKYVYEGFSEPLDIYLSHATSDYITINTSVPRHVYLQFNKKQLPVIQPINNVPTYWKAVFSDGYEYPISALISDDIERVLDPGTYTVKFARYGSNGTEGVLGETIPEQFIVSDNISLSTISPTSVLPSTSAEFLSNAASNFTIKYLWTFSDGYTSIEQNVIRSFNKSGRYKWELNVTDSTGDSARASGQFIVVFSTAIPGGLSKTQEARIS